MIKLNGHVIEPTIFPDGTSQVWKIKDYLNKPGHHIMPMQHVEWWFENEAELFHLAQLSMILGGPASLYMPYCPYARQDKSGGDDVTFALYPFLRILESMKWSEIRTIDMHNINPVKLYKFNWLNNRMDRNLDHYDTVIYPDAGAAKRYDIDHDNIAIGHKVRDQSSGWITHYDLEGDVRGNVVVVDDLCDGGLTFILLAKSIENVKRLDLMVTHGIFSKGLSELLNWYDTIYTTNSFFGHTIRTNSIIEDLKLNHHRTKVFGDMWEAVQRQQLVIEGV